jgi:hypothetical protein
MAGAPITVHLREDTHSFTGDDGHTVWCGGYAPITEDGQFLSLAEHHASDPHCFYCKVAGVQHYPALTRKQFGPDSQIGLVAEPTNPYDKNAVAVWDIADACQVGYVPAELSGEIAQLLRTGVALGGIVIREFRAGSSKGKRTALHILIAPVGRVSLVIHDGD